MCAEAVTILQAEAKASGADQLTDAQIEAEIAAAREALRQKIDAGLADADAGRVHEGEDMFDELTKDR